MDKILKTINEGFDRKYLKEDTYNADLGLADKVRLAKNPNTSLDILNKLINDSEGIVRWGVAKNLNTPLDILSKLANDSFPSVRIAVAENSNTHIYTLMSLAKDDKWEVRASVAQNPNTPLDILKKLARDEDEDVRKIVRSRLPYEVDENDFGYTDDDFEDWK